MHILSLIDIKKMIPVPLGYYKKIMFDEIAHLQYKKNFKKRISFLLKNKRKTIK